MRMTGIIFLIIGILSLGYLVFDLFDPNGRNEIVPFLSQNWSAIIACFTLGAGVALLVASQPKYRNSRKNREQEKINA